jgi:hypothetical protein
MPAGFMLRNRLRFEFVKPEQVLRLSRNALAASGVAVGTVTARAVAPLPEELAGVVVALDGDAPQDRTPACDRNADPLCAGDAVFNNYTIEVVQRIGYDSFTPDNGVLMARNKDREGNTCGYNCFTWVIDAHPEDIRMLDFTRPDGTRVMRTVADYRQLNDALFHAGLRSGSQYEWEDAPNRLHFYVVDVRRDPAGILSYVVGVRSLDGAGPQARGVSAGAASAAASHPGAAASAFAYDIYRVTAAIDGDGWTADLRNALSAIRPGASSAVPVEIRRTSSSSRTARLTVTATSESDPSRKAVVTTTLSSR